jgi:hypothetical protein
VIIPTSDVDVFSQFDSTTDPSHHIILDQLFLRCYRRDFFAVFERVDSCPGAGGLMQDMTFSLIYKYMFYLPTASFILMKFFMYSNGLV